MDTIFNGLSGWGKVGLPGAYASTAAVDVQTPSDRIWMLGVFCGLV